MSDDATRPEAPARSFSWLKAALIASLAVNLLFIGGGLARWYVGFGPERYARLTQTQIIPRYFFRDLDRSRRLELMAVLKSHDREIRDGRRQVKAAVVELANALEAEPYDPARVKTAVTAFTAQSEVLFTTGADAALAVIDKLTPEERKQMAQHLRAREEHGRGSPDDGKKPDAP